VPVVIISDDQDILDLVESNGFGDVSVLNGNSNSNEIESFVNRVIEESSPNEESRIYCPLIIGSSPEIAKIKKKISDLDYVNETVLIQGEPGTGKELMARFIHLKSKRHNHPFVKLSLPLLPADFFEKQLLIREDPHTQQKGIFSAAHQGTLLLEEIDKMPAEPQSTLLKLIDEAGIFKTPDDAIDVRIIATASQDLATLAESGYFRKGLFYRLNVIRIDLPPLRRRLEDISALADFFTDKFCIESGRSHFQLSEKMKKLFIAKKLSIHKKYRGMTDYYQDINALAGLSDVKKHVKDLDNISLKKIGSIFLERAEKKLVKKALDSTNWNRKRAAKLLDISYKSLLNKIKEYKLT
jgi:DNA-binding NtrC family response regulator